MSYGPPLLLGKAACREDYVARAQPDSGPAIRSTNAKDRTVVQIISVESPVLKGRRPVTVRSQRFTEVRRLPPKKDSALDVVRAFLHQRKWLEAEKQCRFLQLSFHYHRSVVVAGFLARALLEQGSHRYAEAEEVLTRQHTFLHQDGGITPSADLHANVVMSRLLKSRGAYTEAQTILHTMRQWYCRNQRLLLSTPCGALHMDMAMVRLLQEKRDFIQALALLQAMRAECCGNRWLPLDAPCRKHNLDFAMVRLLEGKSDFLSATALLQAMRRQYHGNALLAPDVPCGMHKLDLAMVRLLQKQNNSSLGFNLLQTMRSCYCGVDRLALNVPCGRQDLDMTMVRLLEKQGRFFVATELLQKMRSCSCDCDWLTLDVPCNKLDLDLEMVRLLGDFGYPVAAMTLLRTVRTSFCSDKPLSLDKPCGNYRIDLAAVRCLQQSAEPISLDAYFEHYSHSRLFVLIQLSVYVQTSDWVAFDELAATAHDCSELDLMRSARYLTHYIRLVLTTGGAQQTVAGGRSDSCICRKALEIASRALEKYPADAALLNQKARCLRMLGYPPGHWIPLFDKANGLQPERSRFEKEALCEDEEIAALVKLGLFDSR